MSLHLRYRLWIAEMNADINILRIFDDYIAEIAKRKNEEAVQAGIKNFSQEFVTIRKDIDDLRHEMHLAKMTLAAHDREIKNGNTREVLAGENHPGLRKRYTGFRKHFNKVKKEFGSFEAAWLP